MSNGNMIYALMIFVAFNVTCIKCVSNLFIHNIVHSFTHENSSSETATVDELLRSRFTMPISTKLGTTCLLLILFKSNYWTSVLKLRRNLPVAIFKPGNITSGNFTCRTDCLSQAENVQGQSVPKISIKHWFSLTC